MIDDNTMATDGDEDEDKDKDEEEKEEGGDTKAE